VKYLSRIGLGISAVFIIGLLFVNGIAYAAEPPPVEEWVARYDGGIRNSEWAYALAVDSSGNVYVTGYSRGSSTSNDYATVKYDSDGNQQWVARYNGPGNNHDYAYALAVDSSGNVYVTGQSYGGTNYDYATVKYDSNGNQQWVARYNGPANNKDVAYALAVDSSGNVYITGYSYGSGTQNDYATIKYDSSGFQQWVSRYNGPGNSSDNARALAVDGSGNVYVTGDSYGSGTQRDYATIKYDSSDGTEQWVSRYNGPGNSSDNARALAVDSSGNVYVTGDSYGSGTRGDYATIKYDSSDGAEQWAARYNGPSDNNDYARALAVNSSGNVYVTGYSYSSSTYYDYATVKYDSSGVQQWVSGYNNSTGFYADQAIAIALDSSGSVYVTGNSYGSGTQNDYATVKYDSSYGAEQWVVRYDGPANYNDNVRALAVDSSGNVYVTGDSQGIFSGTNATYIDYATIKYRPADNEPPTTTATPSPVPNAYGWNNSDVTVSLNATDNGDGSGVKEIHYQVDGGAEQIVSGVSALVLLDMEGELTLTYRAMDNVGNTEAPNSLSVNIDKTPPQITNPLNITVNTDPGACSASGVDLGLPIVSDNYDPDPAIINDAPTTFPKGTTIVTWTATDDAGNSASCTQNITVVDNEPPVITLLGENPQTVECGDSYVELYATASDICCGDLTAGIIVNASAVDTSTVGIYLVTYNVTDGNGNPAVQVTRTVNVVDTTPPVITLLGENPQTIECGDSYVELYATASDICCGDLTAGIIVDASAVDTSTVGIYLVTYNVTDGNGNPAVQVTRMVNVVDTTPPVVSISVSPDMLWPANHKMVVITVTLAVSDTCDSTPSVVLTSVESNEPDDAKGNGDGKTVDDIQGADIGTEDYEILLRAERAGNGDGRTYTITYTVTDASGNSTIVSVTVIVPHDHGKNNK